MILNQTKLVIHNEYNMNFEYKIYNLIVEAKEEGNNIKT